MSIIPFQFNPVPGLKDTNTYPDTPASPRQVFMDMPEQLRDYINDNIVDNLNNKADKTTDFAKSLIANGYQKLPSGLIIQWGVSSLNLSNSRGSVAITSAIPFPTGVLFESASCIGINDAESIEMDSIVTNIKFYNNNTASVYASCLRSTGLTYKINFKWFAIGY